MFAHVQIKELKQKISELESGVNKQEYEASELKVKIKKCRCMSEECVSLLMM